MSFNSFVNPMQIHSSDLNLLWWIRVTVLISQLFVASLVRSIVACKLYGNLKRFTFHTFLLTFRLETVHISNTHQAVLSPTIMHQISFSKILHACTYFMNKNHSIITHTFSLSFCSCLWSFLVLFLVCLSFSRTSTSWRSNWVNFSFWPSMNLVSLPTFLDRQHNLD